MFRTFSISDYRSNTKIRNNTTAFFLILFAVSLPFNAFELDLFSIHRFELKLTMITFLLLFIIWIINDFKYQATRTSKEKIFYFFVLMYGLSQFVSLINSPLPYESIKQGIIVGSLLTVIIVVSETVLDRKMLEKVLIAMGITSLIVGMLSVISRYFIVGDFNVRLGQGDRTLGIIGLGGDTFYFGDILFIQ